MSAVFYNGEWAVDSKYSIDEMISFEIQGNELLEATESIQEKNFLCEMWMRTYKVKLVINEQATD